MVSRAAQLLHAVMLDVAIRNAGDPNFAPIKEIRAMDPHDWKNDELRYCQNLVQFDGDANVPAAAIDSYLEVQRVCAHRDGRLDVIDKLEELFDARADGTHGPFDEE